jgi:hypothetical protein
MNYQSHGEVQLLLTNDVNNEFSRKLLDIKRAAPNLLSHYLRDNKFWTPQNEKHKPDGEEAVENKKIKVNCSSASFVHSAQNDKNNEHDAGPCASIYSRRFRYEIQF